MLEVPVIGHLLVNDPGTLLSACLAGLGFAQMMEIYLGDLLPRRLIAVLPEWSDERFPLYLIYPSRRLAPAKLRAFSEFVQASAMAAAARGAGARRPRGARSP